jgi:hypothetical protein
MIRSLLAIVLVLLACLFSISEELVFALYPPQAGQPAPIAVRANRAIALEGEETAEGLPAPGAAVAFRTGAVLVPFRKVMDADDLRLIREVVDPQRRALLSLPPLAFFVAVWSIVFLGTFLLALPRGGYRHTASPSVLVTLLILQLLTIKGLMLLTALPIEILPIGLLPLLVVALNQGRITAVGVATAGILISGLAVGRSWDLTVGWLMVGLTAVTVAPKALQLGSALRAGVLIGLVDVIFLLLAGEDWRGLSQLLPQGAPSLEWLKPLAAHPAAVRSGWAMAAGLASALLALVLFPFLRAGRNIGSTLTLRRFSDLDQPLLKRLFTEAPGTYQHAMNVAYLAQAAGNAIDADPLLLRIGAYFHDIGKLARPEGFIENQIGGDNLHDRIDPYESIAIIHGHMLQGVRMAREARLPAVVIDLIEQHHGTQSVEFFHQKALKLGSREAVREQDFRYPGPKPRTVEAALLMIADAVEAASRTLKSPGRSSFDKLVRLLIVKRIADGQFVDCNLDTRDIEAITVAMTDALEASYHNRIRYPWQQAPPATQRPNA